MTCKAHPVLVKKANQMCGSFLFKISMSGPPVDGPKDPWPPVLSLPGRFVGDPASLARNNIMLYQKGPCDAYAIRPSSCTV